MQFGGSMFGFLIISGMSLASGVSLAAKPATSIGDAMRSIGGASGMMKDSQQLLKSTANTKSSVGVVAYGKSIAQTETLDPSAVFQMEAAVTDLILNADAATPMGDSVGQISKLINDTMMPKVLHSHRANQAELEKLAKQLSHCGTIMVASVKAADKQKHRYETNSPLHKACRAREAALATEEKSCKISVAAQHQVRDLKCNAFKSMGKLYGSEARNKQVVAKMSGESEKMYIKRVTTSYCGVGDGKPGGSMYEKYEIAEKECAAAELKFKTVTAECEATHKGYKSKVQECNNVQSQMDGAACQRAVLVKDACEGYAQCFTGGTAAYNVTATTVKKEESDRKNEWKALNRMKCLIDAFGDGSVTDAEVTACKGKNHSTTVLDIKYPQLMDQAKCTVPSLYPATAAYKKAEFATLPVLARGNPEANECYGVLEISTKPKDGSPSTCKCERITMNGPYHAGALVKCVSCLDVFRSTDKDSCPDGTKIFSPRSRNDWKSLLSSIGPLRAPNWIIDVTRPQNGCGGCTKNAMTHENKLQASWVTSDGSAWWLRSTTYNEPNGDYSANCYMDLWHTPHHADQVTFNDQKCTYHSKSYYCQAKQISTKPKHGSPPGCQCLRVELTGKYSPGMLIKCMGCLKVSKANDKNSCPEGTKVFSPRSREDWGTFISSATPLRAPHWIIDVTRPQNGCGGCTKAPMNFETPSQVSWRAEDGSPWWLRSTKYSEPNGDYSASCYLDLWHNPANADSVTFNDGRCNYHANSYYCQPTLASLAH